MEPTTRSAVIAAVVAISAGAGIGYALLLATGSHVLGMVMASASANLVNNFVRNMLEKGKQ